MRGAFNCSQTKLSNYCKRTCLLNAKFLLDLFALFLLSSEFYNARPLSFCDLSCSNFKIMSVLNIKAIVSEKIAKTVFVFSG